MPLDFSRRPNFLSDRLILKLIWDKFDRAADARLRRRLARAKVEALIAPPTADDHSERQQGRAAQP
jgi:hypothetical protein